jgi:ribosomal protein S13
MFLKKNLIILKKNSEKFSKKDLYSLRTIGCSHFFLLKKKIACDIGHPTGGLRKNLFLELQELFKKNVQFDNQGKLKEKFFLKIKKLQNYKFSRLERNLPMRGQRTHTNAKTRKKRYII